MLFHLPFKCYIVKKKNNALYQISDYSRSQAHNDLFRTRTFNQLSTQLSDNAPDCLTFRQLHTVDSLLACLRHDKNTQSLKRILHFQQKTQFNKKELQETITITKTKKANL